MRPEGGATAGGEPTRAQPEQVNGGGPAGARPAGGEPSAALAGGEPPPAKPPFYRRFGAGQLVEHWSVFVSFYMLVVTGVAQRYYESGWAQTAILAFGGFDETRFIHRVFGVLFAVSFVNHFALNIYAVFVKRAVYPGIVPTLKDARDAANYLKHSLGMPAAPLRSDRYDFRQKFEYWGMVFGGIVMIATGIILVYPTTVTAFVQGVVVAAAKEFHRNEAMLAFLTIVIWHLYSAHLRPEVFPLDPAIFDGKLSRNRMEEEHPLELERSEEPEPQKGPEGQARETTDSGAVPLNGQGDTTREPPVRS